MAALGFWRADSNSHSAWGVWLFLPYLTFYQLELLSRMNCWKLNWAGKFSMNAPECGTQQVDPYLIKSNTQPCSAGSHFGGHLGSMKMAGKSCMKSINSLHGRASLVTVEKIASILIERIWLWRKSRKINQLPLLYLHCWIELSSDQSQEHVHLNVFPMVTFPEWPALMKL